MELVTLARDVRAVLTDELRRPEYRGSPNPVAGHCYVASEALFHIFRGRAMRGWKPMFIRHEDEPHWFLRHDSGLILDLTASQFKTPVPYERAIGKGFLTKEPSKRAKKVIDRWQLRQAEPIQMRLVG